ncbi:MAG: hypothetical protein A4S09_00660 [Proteobacteria bacterium SG_bin7]|nr:MAG: hypothetical protein A4S09_00660 [Proteobacteria bacterium SG_bin7]
MSADEVKITMSSHKSYERPAAHLSLRCYSPFDFTINEKSYTFGIVAILYFGILVFFRFPRKVSRIFFFQRIYSSQLVDNCNSDNFLLLFLAGTTNKRTNQKKKVKKKIFAT